MAVCIDSEVNEETREVQPIVKSIVKPFLNLIAKPIYNLVLYVL